MAPNRSIHSPVTRSIVQTLARPSGVASVRELAVIVEEVLGLGAAARPVAGLDDPLGAQRRGLGGRTSSATTGCLRPSGRVVLRMADGEADLRRSLGDGPPSLMRPPSLPGVP